MLLLLPCIIWNLCGDNIFTIYELDILVGITIHKLRGLRTFLLCSSIARSNEHTNDCKLAISEIPIHRLRALRRLLLCSNDNVDTIQGSFLVRLEAFVSKILDGRFSPMFSVRGEFRKYLVTMVSFEEEISTWYTSLSDYLQTSDSPVSINQIKDICYSVRENLDDFLSFHGAYVGILVNEIEGLKENITFLTNFICFSTLLCAENQDIHDLQVLVQHLVISAAYLTVQLFSASHYKVFHVDVKNSTIGLSYNEIKSIVYNLLLKIKPVDDSLLHETSSRALESLKC